MHAVHSFELGKEQFSGLQKPCSWPSHESFAYSILSGSVCCTGKLVCVKGEGETGFDIITKHFITRHVSAIGQQTLRWSGADLVGFDCSYMGCRLQTGWDESL